MKLFVLGLDGASYRLIHRFAMQGKLPNFTKLIQEGIFLKINSTNPPHTAPGWTSAFSGAGPGQHGIYQFWDTQAPDYTGEYMGSSHVGVPMVWDILNYFSYRTIMVNIPMTYPPKKVDGIMISWPLSNTLRYAYPEDILFELAKSGGHYASDINHMFQQDMEYIGQAIEVTKKRLKTVEYLLKKKDWDLFISVFTEIDRISHYYWNFMDKASPEYKEGVNKTYKTAIEDIYRESDAALGRILNLLPEDAAFMVLSDHGFTVGELDFYVQTFLYQHSLLFLKEAKEERKEADSWFYTRHGGTGYEVDWSKTLAYMAAPGSYGININRKGRQKQGIVEPGQYEAVRDQVIKLLEDVRHPNQDIPLFEKVLRREEVYSGELVGRAPDIIMVPRSYSTMVHHKIQLNALFGGPEQKGMHDQDAIFGLYGRGIRLSGKRICSMEQVAPTILNFFSIRAPEYMSGLPIAEADHPKEAFKDYEWNPMKQEGQSIRKAYTAQESQEVSEKLKALGYL